MRKTRSLAFCQRHEHILIGLFLASGLAFAGPGCHQHYHYYNTDPCAPAFPCRAACVRRPLCDHDDLDRGRWDHVADGSTRSTTVSGGQSTVAARRRQQGGQLVAVLFLATLRLGSLAQTSVQGSLDDYEGESVIGQWSVVGCQLSVEDTVRGGLRHSRCIRGGGAVSSTC